jgi:hypothetical protein
VSWLIALYPPAWRRRYGRELAELLATQRASFGMAIDLIAGAIDAWFNPQSSTAARAADAKGAGTMVSRMLQLRCAGHGPAVTAEDHRKAVAVTIGGTLALVLPLLWAIKQYGNTPYLQSLMVTSWLIPTAFSQRYTSLKGRSRFVQTVLIGGQAAFVIAITLAAAWFGATLHHVHHS